MSGLVMSGLAISVAHLCVLELDILFYHVTVKQLQLSHKLVITYIITCMYRVGQKNCAKFFLQ